MATSSFQIRPAHASDEAGLGRLAEMLVLQHHQMDPSRFFKPEGPIAAGYGKYLAEQAEDPKAVVVVAVTGPDQAVTGYAWGRLQGRNWMMLLDACGCVHDVFVDPAVRRQGVATALMRGLIEGLERKGASRIVLYAGEKNDASRALFRKLGFRDTMVEMMRDRPPA